MPIDYTHGSTGLYALAANRVGAGQAARRDQERQFEEALRLAQLAEQQRQFDIGTGQRQQGIDFGEQNARRNYNLNLYNQFNQNSQRNADRQARFALNDIQFQQGLAGKDFQNQLGQENLSLQYGLMGERDLAQHAMQREDQELLLANKAADSADEQARSMLTEYRRLPLNEQEQATLAEYSARIRRMQGQRISLAPEQYAKAMGELITELEQAGIEGLAKQPTIQSMMESGQLYKDPDGEGWWGVEYRNGQAVPRFFPKPKASAGAKDEIVDTPFGRLPPEKAHATKYDLLKRAREELIEEAIPQNGTSPSKYPNKAEIVKRARELMEAEQELFGGQGATAETPKVINEAGEEVDYESLESGDLYQDPQGNWRTKS